ncbi:hypothetical protein CDO73_07200 [Saccharibacillus sp. O23]|uniref:hypothetical protein n=1 Tax=Saccharibacillus sp. O23 TaxID=2009338 RepID=UPI000B4E69CE|nr:hypothetical protein [Saccharibacillus sp. O23]OWR31504.1 hypothetical protein CDO73_07200 [Saccharibacillus sp. O23]
MKYKWMAIGLIAILTACGGNTEAKQDAPADVAETAAQTEEAAPQPETTVNKDGSITTTTSKTVGATTGSTQLQSKTETDSDGSGSLNVDTTINTDAAVNMDATVNVESTINVDPTITVESGSGEYGIGPAIAEKVGDYEDYDPKKVVQVVTKGTLDRYPDKTVGEAFNEFFNHPKWRYYKSELNEDVVEFTGDAIYAEEKGRMTVQFLLYDDHTFEIFGIWVGSREPSSDEEYSLSDDEIVYALEDIYEPVD